jgi:hypothetical protein
VSAPYPNPRASMKVDAKRYPVEKSRGKNLRHGEL